jgi:RNA polymerase sigma factor (sigma-70 family)
MKIIHTKTDPNEVRGRISCMLIKTQMSVAKPPSLFLSKRATRLECVASIGKAVKLGQKTESAPACLWLEEFELIQQHKSVEAFGRIFSHFAPKIKAFLMKSGTDAAMAEECAQEVMATVWHKAHLFDPTRASAATWIFTIARNKRIDAIRKLKRPEPENLDWGPEHEPDQEEVIELQQETAKLGQALAKLPEKQRVLVERAYFKDMSHSEIATATGLPLGTIKSRIRLALERLRHAMK